MRDKNNSLGTVTVLWVMIVFFTLPLFSQTSIKIRDLPSTTSLSDLDMFPIATFSPIATKKVTVGSMKDTFTSADTIITCTPPLLCDGSTSMTLGGDRTLSLSIPFTLIGSGSALWDEPGQSNLGASPHLFGLAEGSSGSPVTDAQPTVAIQRRSAGSTNSISVLVTEQKDSGSGYHYPFHVFVRDLSNATNDIVANSGSLYKDASNIVANLAGTPSASGGTLATGTYSYYVSAIVGGSEIIASEHIDVSVTGPTGKVTLTWTGVSGATDYRAYRYVATTPNTSPVYFAVGGTGTTIQDTGGAGTAAVGLSSTGWGGWDRVEKSPDCDSCRLAGRETDVGNNTGRDAGANVGRVGSTIGYQIVSFGNADNSTAIDITGESDARFHSGILFRSEAFRDVGIDFVQSDATKPAIRLANNQWIVGDASGVNVNLLKFSSLFYPEIERPLTMAATSIVLSNGVNNDIAIGTSPKLVRISGPTSAYTIAGIASGIRGRTLILLDTTGQTFSIQNEAGTSTAANRIITYGGSISPVDFVTYAEFVYDESQSRWILAKHNGRMVGIGTTSPEVPLHIYGSNTSDVSLALGPNPDGNPGTESAVTFGYGGASFGRATGFINVRPDSGAASGDPSFRFLIGNAEKMRLNSSGNIGLNATAFGTSSVNVIAIGSGTAPTTSPADTIQLWSADSAAGDANLYARNEAGISERITALRKRVTSQFDKTSNTTFSDVTGLSFNVETNKVYGFRAILPTVSNASGGVKFQILGTATVANIWYEGELHSGGTITQTRANATGTPVCNVTAVTAATCYIEGALTVTNAGTITVQFAQNASNGTASSVLLNAKFFLEPIGN